MEKFTVEMIDLYLEDKLDSSERKKMEEAMVLNPELKEEMMLQKVFVQKIKDQALKSLIYDAHLRHINSGNSGSNFLSGGKWMLGIILSVIVVAGLIFYLFTEKENKEVNDEKIVHISNKENMVTPIIEGVQEPIDENLPEVPFMVYKFFADKGAIIKDRRSGAVIRIPANILINKDGGLVKGEVTLKYREFRTQADIALSGIPMTYKDHNFNSAGMFEIYAFQNGDTLDIKNNRDISIDFVMTKNESGIGFYELNEERKQWEFIHPIRNEIATEADSATSEQMAMGELSNIDPFIRSLGYQKAAVEGKAIIPELPERPKKNFNTLFVDKNYKQIAGIDTNVSNRIVIEEIKKAKKESGFVSFFKRIFLTGGALTIPINADKAPKVDTSLSIVVKKKRYTIYENGRNIVMAELASLKGTQFIYNGSDDFAQLTKQPIYDARLTRDTTALNQFYLELKTDGKILKYSLQLSKPDFTSFTEYEKQHKLRILTYDSRIKLKEREYQDLIKLRDERAKLLDSVSFYGNENIFRMARLIMTEDELNMSQREWFASLDTNKSLRKRIDSHLDSIKAYGDNADVYIDKLANERKINIDRNRINQNLFDQTDPGHYFNPLVCNLKIRGFGVYNCDQVYRIKNLIVIKGMYVTEGGIQIMNLKAISLIDPRVNAAFSFDPKLFECSSTGDNMLLLFTKNNKIYFLDRTKWKAKQVKKGGTYTFEMSDITSIVKTSEDLQRILEENLL